jgi:outer membrane receptor protein involved in Fe transport
MEFSQMKAFIHLTPAIILFAFLTLTAAAQTIDTVILGTITDSSGAVVAGATVTVLSSATGVSKVASTNAAGEFEVRYLTPGTYDVSVQANGFSSQTQKGIVVQISQQEKLSFSLSVSTRQENVVVQAGQQLLQTEDASLGEVVGPERTENLPLNGRKFDDLAILTPGVAVYNPDLHSSSTDGSAISANGGRVTWGQVNIDGITMVNNRHNYVNLYPSVDAIQEFKVQTGNYSAQYGGNAGSNVNIQVKSGTNEFHGDVFEFIRNDAVDARNYFIPAPIPKNILKQNQFGATLGGPIVKKKTFFFVSYEGLRSVEAFPKTTVVLTSAQKNGDFSADGTTVINPFTGQPYANNMVPQSQLNPVALNIANNYMPQPNSSGNTNYAGSSIGNLSVNQYIARVDEYFNDNNQLFLHYIYAKRNFPNTDLNPNFKFTGTYPAQNMALQYLHVFNPKLVNEFRFGANLEHVQQLSTLTNTGFTIESLGINGMKVGGPNGRPLKPNEEGFPVLGISGYIGVGSDLAASNLDDSRSYQLVDDVSWTKGKHAFTFGTDIRYIEGNATTNNWPFGQISFTGDITGDPAADFLLGYPKTTLTPEGVPITKARQWRSAEYVQDNWKVRPNLTINAGLRYDLFAPPIDVNGVTRTLDFSTSPPTFTPAPGLLLHNIWSITHKDFGPRVGFAYSPTSNMVVRAGYGLFYFGGQFDNINILQLNPPTAGSLTITNPNVDPIATIEEPIPLALYPTNPFFNAVTLTEDRKRPDMYLQTWNLTVSRQFGANVLDVGYVGVKGTKIDSSIKNWNSPPPGKGDIQSRRPFNTYARIRYPDFEGASSYNALQVHLEHRLAHALSFTAAYTYSHELDNQANDTNNGGCGCQDPRNPHEWANGVADQRQNLAIGYVWQIPALRSDKSLVKSVTGGWGLSGLMLFASGIPFDVEESIDSQNTDGIWERPLLVPGQKLTVPNRSKNQWFNTDAFAPSNYVYGNSPRNPLNQAGTKVLNLSVTRSFKMPFAESQRLEMRFEAFNALNTPQYAAPDANLGDGTFGQVTSTQINNRELQLAAKYFF